MTNSMLSQTTQWMYKLAIAIANALKEKVKGVEILFVGAKGKMEMEKVPKACGTNGYQRKSYL